MWRYRDCLANGCLLFSKNSAPDVVCVWRLAAPDRSRWGRGLLSLPFPPLAEARSTASQPVRKMRSKWPGSRFREIERLAAGVMQMNRLHRWYCRSSRWKRTLDNNILPWALSGIQLGEEVLEVGPGPGLTTDWLRSRVKRLTCIEMDSALANSLRSRTANSNVTVECGDAAAMPFADEVFSSAVCFTMLHHVPSTDLQDRLFAEVYRVLKPGGIFAGTDSLQSLLMKLFHLRDTMLLVDPSGLPSRLESVGFRNAEIEIGAGRFRFFAQRPS